MSVQAMTWVFDHSPVSGSGERLVLLALANHADAKGYGAFPSKRTIGEETRLHPSHVRKILRRLEEDGAIVPTGVSQWSTTIYRIVMGEQYASPREHEGSIGGGIGGSSDASQTVNRKHEEVLRTSSEQEVIFHDEPLVEEVVRILADAARERQVYRPQERSIRKTLADFPERDAVQVARECAFWLTDGNGARRQKPNVAQTYRTFMSKPVEKKSKSEYEDKMTETARMIKERMGW